MMLAQAMFHLLIGASSIGCMAMAWSYMRQGMSAYRKAHAFYDEAVNLCNEHERRRLQTIAMIDQSVTQCLDMAEQIRRDTEGGQA